MGKIVIGNKSIEGIFNTPEQVQEAIADIVSNAIESGKHVDLYVSEPESILFKIELIRYTSNKVFNYDLPYEHLKEGIFTDKDREMIKQVKEHIAEHYKPLIKVHVDRRDWNGL